MPIFTVGHSTHAAEAFTARRFFEMLRTAGVRRVVDVRLYNVSQLAGFAKRKDLEYFFDEIGGIGYAHVPERAPTREMRRGAETGR